MIGSYNFPQFYSLLLLTFSFHNRKVAPHFPVLYVGVVDDDELAVWRLNSLAALVLAGFVGVGETRLVKVVTALTIVEVVIGAAGHQQSGAPPTVGR